jgi:hypothetical protein
MTSGELLLSRHSADKGFFLESSKSLFAMASLQVWVAHNSEQLFGWAEQKEQQEQLRLTKSCHEKALYILWQQRTLQQLWKRQGIPLSLLAWQGLQHCLLVHISGSHDWKARNFWEARPSLHSSPLGCFPPALRHLAAGEERFEDHSERNGLYHLYPVE